MQSSAQLLHLPQSQLDLGSVFLLCRCSELREGSWEQAQMVLVGNKLDLADSARQVTQSEGASLAEDLGVPHIETSAKDGQNVNEAFGLLIDNVLDQMLATLQSGDTSDPIVARATDSRSGGSLKTPTESSSCSC